MCRIWPSHLSSASPWSSLAILGAKANPVCGCVLMVLLAVYMCLHNTIHVVACIACGSFPLSEISIWAFGLTPGLDYSFVHSQLYPRDGSGTRQRSECSGSRRM